MPLIYALACAHDKYYVGRCDHASRIDDHFRGAGAAWTKKYKPYRRLFVEQGDRFDEDKHVLRLMAKCGVENVRGGTFSRVVLPKADLETIEHMMRGASDRCFHCGQPGHFVNECPQMRDNAGNPWSHEEDDRLIGEMAIGMSLNDICTAHGRSRKAIISRMKRLETPENMESQEPLISSDEREDDNCCFLDFF